MLARVISGISRRRLLCAIPIGVAAAQVRQPAKTAKPLPVVGEFTRITDPVTENIVVRLTMPTSTSYIPFPRNHFVSTRERTLLFSSDRTGHFQPFQIDLRTGVVRQLAETAALQPRSLCFDRQEKAVRYLDGKSLFEIPVSRGKPRPIAEGVTSFAAAGDGSLFLIADGKLKRKESNDWRTLADSVSEAWPQPTGMGCVFARPAGAEERDLYYVSTDQSGETKKLASGRVHEPFWDADGQSILFLRDVILPNGTMLAEIRRRGVQGDAETVVSPTSQFACFTPNSNASVFVGASRSHAQPNVVLLLRSPYREMTLCEHRSSRPGDVSPVFSPDNRRIYFESDHEGRSAIYSVNVELLVEPE